MDILIPIVIVIVGLFVVMALFRIDFGLRPPSGPEPRRPLPRYDDIGAPRPRHRGAQEPEVGPSLDVYNRAIAKVKRECSRDYYILDDQAYAGSDKQGRFIAVPIRKKKGGKVVDQRVRY